MVNDEWSDLKKKKTVINFMALNRCGLHNSFFSYIVRGVYHLKLWSLSESCSL